MTSFFLITLLVLPLLGGLIAWLGDVIGYRLGRSRRSLFGLRPRTTARLVGIVAGAVLPLIGLTVAAVGSEEVRAALLYMDKLREEAEQLAGYNEKLRVDRQRLLSKVHELSGREAEATRRATEAGARADAAERQAQQAQSRLAALNRRLSEAQRKLRLAEKQRKELQAQRDQLKLEVESLTRERDQLIVQLDESRRRSREIDLQRRAALAELETTQKQLAQERSRLEDLEREAKRLTADRDNLAAELKDLTRRSAQLHDQVARLERNLASTEEALDEKQKQLERAESRLSAAEEYLLRLNEQYAAWLREERLIEDSPVVYEPGHEIVRVLVSTKQRRDQIEAALEEVLVLANNAALRQRVPPDSSGRALLLVRPLPAQADLRTLPSEKDIIKEVARRMIESGEEGFVVRIRTLERHFLLEPRQVHVEMAITPDKVRFREGEVVSRLRLDPPLQRAEVLRRIIMARSELRNAAIARGMLPDPATGEYGGLAAEDILSAIDEVARAQTPVEIRIVAARPVRTAEPLIVKLEVHRIRE
ncbi:MAG: DUF3084 domain-containing protein [Armatimonadota bacterium]